MARKNVAEFLPADDETVFEVMTTGENNVPTSQQKRLEDIINDLNDDSDDAEIRLYRQSPQGGKSALIFLDSFPADKFQGGDLHKYLRDNYGGGDYRIHIRASGKVRANKLITVEAPKVTEHKATPIGEAGSILQTVLERQEKMNQQMLALMQQMSQPQQSRTEMLNEMLLFKQLFDNGGNSNGLSQLRDSIAILGELGVNVGGPQEEKESGFGDLLEKMTPLLGAAMSQPQQPQQRRDPMFAQKMMLKTGLQTLLKAASKDSDRVTYAEMITDQLPENTIKEFIVAPDAFDKLTKLEPQVAHYRVWFTDLSEHLKALMGLPSIHADLYTDDDGAINAESNDEIDDDGTDNL